MCLKISSIAGEKVPFQVDKAICDRTTKCPCGFGCLKTGSCPGCEVENSFGKEHAFVKMKACNEKCPYAIPFAFSFICNCPVRYEIYRKYRK